MNHDNWDDDNCSECNTPLDNGEGTDGRCGNCADQYDNQHRCDNCDEETPHPETLTNRLCPNCQ